jgi:hypothetical protein
MRSGRTVNNVVVQLLDGPCAGRPTRYGHPLPAILVVADKTDPRGIKWHDYRQHGPTGYRHAKDCPCERQWQVDLDVARA